MDDAPADPAVTPVGPLVRQHHTVVAVVAAGGALGSLARWGLGQLLAPRPGGPPGFPWATFTANVTGCLLLGALSVFLAERRPTSRLLRLFIGVGVLGGFTTFSTLMLETRSLLTAGRPGLALGYVATSVLAGLAAVVAGMRLMRATGPA
jgi:fluoride exporter